MVMCKERKIDTATSYDWDISTQVSNADDYEQWFLHVRSEDMTTTVESSDEMKASAQAGTREMTKAQEQELRLVIDRSLNDRIVEIHQIVDEKLEEEVENRKRINEFQGDPE